MVRIKNKWALILMGGGARGLVHIGILDVFHEIGLIPDIIVGTSMGGIVGGLYARGFSPDRLKVTADDLSFENFLEKIKLPSNLKTPKTMRDYLIIKNYRDQLLKKMGLDREDSIERYLKSLVGEILIEELPIQFACNAVDLLSGKEVIFKTGPLYKALRATMSLPLIFEPVKHEGMLLVDGGFIDNAPVKIARTLGADTTVLVDIHRRVKHVAQTNIKNTFVLIQRLMEIMSSSALEEKIQKADFILRIKIDIDSLDFSDTKKIIDAGRKGALKNLSQVKKIPLGL